MKVSNNSTKQLGVQCPGGQNVRRGLHVAKDRYTDADLKEFIIKLKEQCL